VSQVEVRVASDGVPVEGAAVCVFSENAGVFEVAQTDAAGRAELSVSVVGPFEAYVTVTAKNAIPHSETLTLGGETDVAGGMGEIPMVTALIRNYPNPFNPATSIAFSLAVRERVGLSVYDVSGRLVAVLIDDDLAPGLHAARWDGRDEGGSVVASGTYFARMTAGGSHFETKMILTR
jgi:hypothetical protein